MNIQISLTPSESKRLVAKGVLEYLKDRIDDGNSILVTRGSTNAYVLEELLKHIGAPADFNKADFITGEILAGGNERLWANKRRKPEVVIKGKAARDVKDDADRLTTVQRMRAGDVVVKGANAIDHKGTVGVLLGDPKGGGTVGSLLGPIKAKGVDLVVPIGLEKMVWGEIDGTSQMAGSDFARWSQGMAVGLFPLSATVITEVDALEMLFDVEAFQLASGGLGAAQGSVVLLVEGEDEELDKCRAFLEKEVFGEGQLQPNPAE
ncbi:MAG: hypothetical protein JW839_11095 [Candidatus Lokiarchaeota archaeon]|nr:hypothetical protein [Candidatus Lokiarchaeota archaeon]